MRWFKMRRSSGVCRRICPLRFDSFALEDGRYPEHEGEQDKPDFVFTRYNGRKDAAYPDFEGVDGKIYDPNGGEVPLKIDLKQKN